MFNRGPQRSGQWVCSSPACHCSSGGPWHHEHHVRSVAGAPQRSAFAKPSVQARTILVQFLSSGSICVLVDCWRSPWPGPLTLVMSTSYPGRHVGHRGGIALAVSFFTGIGFRILSCLARARMNPVDALRNDNRIPIELSCLTPDIENRRLARVPRRVEGKFSHGMNALAAHKLRSALTFSAYWSVFFYYLV